PTDSRERPHIATDAPERKRDSAIARPMPRVPPVTTACLPRKKASMRRCYAGKTHVDAKMCTVRALPEDSSPAFVHKIIASHSSSARTFLEDSFSHLAKQMDEAV